VLDTSTAAVPGRAARARSLGSSLGQVGERFGVPVLLVFMLILFLLAPATRHQFGTGANIQVILANQSVTGLIALGMVIPMVAGYFDVSAAAIAGISNVMMASLVATHGLPIAVGVIASVAAGCVAGAINGVLIGILRLNPFITTLGSYIVIGGLLDLYTQGRTISGLPLSLGAWTLDKWLGIDTPFWLLILVAVMVWYMHRQTPFGRKLTAIGSNERAARLTGIRVDRAILIAYVLSGLFAGVGGVLLTAQNGDADSTTAISYLFPALAAVFLGQTAITPGRYNVWGTFFGLFLVAVAVDGFTLMGAASWITQVFNGGALLLAVIVSSQMARIRERRARARLGTETEESAVSGRLTQSA
jgi:ribose transport system permease protein